MSKKSYTKVENILTNALNKLAKQDQINFNKIKSNDKIRTTK